MSNRLLFKVNTKKHLYLYIPTRFMICKTPNVLSLRRFQGHLWSAVTWEVRPIAVTVKM